VNNNGNEMTRKPKETPQKMEKYYFPNGDLLNVTATMTDLLTYLEYYYQNTLLFYYRDPVDNTYGCDISLPPNENEGGELTPNDSEPPVNCF
jgi:hypothetical protein